MKQKVDDATWDELTEALQKGNCFQKLRKFRFSGYDFNKHSIRAFQHVAAFSPQLDKLSLTQYFIDDPDLYDLYQDEITALVRTTSYWEVLKGY